MNRIRHFGVIVAALLLLASVLATTGCGKKQVNYGADLTYQGKLVYLIWGGEMDVNQEKAKAALFEAAHPGITVEIVQQNGPWPDILAARQADGTFPDLFWNPELYRFVVSGYVADLSLFKNDVDWGKWNAALMKMANYGGMQSAIPNKYFTSGVYLNKTLLEQNNIDVPAVSWSMDDMLSITRAVGEASKDLRGCAWPIYYPAASTPAGLARALKEGKPFDFGTAENIKFNEIRGAMWKYSNDYLKGVDNKDIWFDTGKIAIMDDMSWGIGWWAVDVNEKKGLPFDWDYYPVPSLEKGGKQYQLAVADFVSVANIAKADGDPALSAAEKEKLTAAYVLLKYLSIDEKAYLDALALGFNSLPVFDSATARAAFMEKYKVNEKAGFKKLIEYTTNPELTIVEPNKFIPGSAAAYGLYFDACLTNDAMAKADYVSNIQQKAAELNTQAAAKIAEESAALKAALKATYGVDWK